MRLTRIRHKLLIALACGLSLSFVAITVFYNRAVERSIIDDHRRTMHRLTDAVVLSIETIMTETHTEIMPDFAQRLGSLPGLVEFRIARADGIEAFKDNETIMAVNARLDEPLFQPRAVAQAQRKVFERGDSALAPLFAGQESLSRVVTREGRGSQFELYDVIPHSSRCKRCHGDGDAIRGVLKVTTSLAEIEEQTRTTRLKSLAILSLSLLLTMAATGYMLGREVAHPIERVTDAMTRISDGDFDSRVPSRRADELGTMAASFNKMTESLHQTYVQMSQEKEKLAMVLEGAQEAVVVADGAGQIVLANEAACVWLGKSAETIRAGGLLQLLDRPAEFAILLTHPDAQPVPTLYKYNGRWLLTSVGRICDAAGVTIGSAALLRDVSDEQRMLLELERLSTTDALTDVFNRRHLDAALNKEFERSRALGLPMAVIMLDVDHFKKFNDTHGHDQGDRVLQAVGAAMKRAVREYDIPCRYGGEEFSIVQPGVTPKEAMLIADRLREQVAAVSVDGLHVTVSLGVACYPALRASSAEALLAAADAALYQSKQAGRNRATLAETLST